MKNILKITTGVVRIITGIVLLLAILVLMNPRSMNLSHFKAPPFSKSESLQLPTFVIHQGAVSPKEGNNLQSIKWSFLRFPDAYLEIDVCEKSNGKLVLLHIKNPNDCDQRFTEETVYLEQILKLLGHYPRARLQIDSKMERGSGYNRLANMILSHGLAEQIIITSNRYAILQTLHITYPSLILGFDPGKIGELNEKKVAEIILKSKAIGANAVYLDYNFLLELAPEKIKKFVEYFHTAKLAVNLWTVDDPNIFLWMLHFQWKVDRITTNHIDTILATVWPNRSFALAGFAN